MKCQFIHLGLVVFILFSVCGEAQQRATNLQNKREKKSSEKAVPLTSHVLLISIDGLRNEDLSKTNLNLPSLKSLRERGSFILNVESVYPSQSLPAHATIVTGMFPSDHGIVSDWKFDEKTGRSATEKYEAASDIKTDTIWQAAKRGELKTVAINFPLMNEAELDFKSQDISSALAWVEKNRPQLTMIRFDGLANSIQRYGLGSAEATAALEIIDSSLKKILEAVERAGITNETTFLVVSSHGYAKVEQEFRPNVMLAKIGFLPLDTATTNWIATVRASGGGAAIYLRDAKNEEMAKAVTKVFEEIYKQESSPIWRILSQKDAAKLGADPRAAFFIEAAPGFLISEQTTGKKTTEKLNATAGQATSGYLPSRSEMRGTLIVAGKGIKPKTQIEYARLIDIAPTIARLLGLELKASRGHVISEMLLQQNQK